MNETGAEIVQMERYLSRIKGDSSLCPVNELDIGLPRSGIYKTLADII